MGDSQVFKEDHCVDHFRKLKGTTKMVGGSDAKAGEEKITPEMVTRFRECTRRPYIDQAKWYLNA